MTDFLDQKRDEIQDRLNELRPLIDEYNRLEEAARALNGVGGNSNGATAPKVTATTATAVKPAGKRRGRPPGRKTRAAAARKKTTRAAATTSTATTTPAATPAAKKATRAKATTRTKAAAGRRGRPKGSGTRATEALKIVSSNPGISIPELATAMGIKQNYLYRVMPTLAEQGLVAKSGKGWAAKAKAKA